MFFFFFKQKTAYEMRISDWSSDVCSSDLTGRPMVYAALFYNELLPDRSRDVLAACRAAQQAGLRVYAQVSCQPLSMDFTLDNAYPMYGVDPWGKLPIADRAAIVGAFGDAGFRRAIRDGPARPVGGRLFNGDWARVEVSVSPAHRAFEGRTVAALDRKRRRVGNG